MYEPDVNLIPNGIETAYWKIVGETGPMMDEDERKNFESSLGISAPEIVFDKSHLTLEHKSGFRVHFDAKGGLLGCKGKPKDPIKCQFAGEWSNSSLAGTEGKIPELEIDYDWTYSTDYAGEYSMKGEKIRVEDMEESSEGLNMPLLKRRDPFLYFKEVPLFTDELHDNGISDLQVK